MKLLKKSLLFMWGYGKLKTCFVPYYRKLGKWIKRLSSIDSIKNYEGFYQAAKPCLHSKKSLSIPTFDWETYFYGYYDEILHYAGIKRWFLAEFSGLEHGIRFGKAEWTYRNHHICYVCQGTKRMYEITEKDPDMPVLAIGPYIYYARDYYKKEEFEDLKRKLGSVLLVFPMHSFEGKNTRIAGSGFAEKIYQKYSAAFDTIMVCVYWNDMQDEVIKEFKNRGAFLVSAGFRGDCNFIRRLKTIIRLSDMVVTNGIGTNIGFGICMKKKTAIECPYNMSPGDSYYETVLYDFYKAFSCGSNLKFTRQQIQMQQKLYDDIWGGHLLLSKNKMRKTILGIRKACKKGCFYIPVIHKKMKREWIQDGIAK